MTGGLIIFVAAGLLAYGLGDLGEAGLLRLGEAAWDTSAMLPTGSVAGSLAKGLLGYNPQPSWAEAIAYLGYLLPALWLFFGQPRLAARRAQRATVKA